MRSGSVLRARTLRGCARRISSGSLAMLSAIRRASSRLQAIAKRIIDMAQRGVEDREALVTDALRFIAANYEQPNKLAK